jgi:hypothetical protein
MSFTYDANGNLTSDGTRTYHWNGLNQLVEVTLGTTVLATRRFAPRSGTRMASANGCRRRCARCRRGRCRSAPAGSRSHRVRRSASSDRRSPLGSGRRALGVRDAASWASLTKQLGDYWASHSARPSDGRGRFEHEPRYSRVWGSSRLQWDGRRARRRRRWDDHGDYLRPLRASLIGNQGSGTDSTRCGARSSDAPVQIAPHGLAAAATNFRIAIEDTNLAACSLMRIKLLANLTSVSVRFDVAVARGVVISRGPC